MNSQNHPLARPPIMIDNDHYVTHNMIGKDLPPHKTRIETVAPKQPG